MRSLLRNQRVASKKIPDRVECLQISERVVFEALVNVVAHRDDSIYGSKTRFLLFDDCLEQDSPDAFSYTVAVENIALRPAMWNALLTTLLGCCPVGNVGTEVGRAARMKKRGDGVPIILRETR